jgi:hypothetical protein
MRTASHLGPDRCNEAGFGLRAVAGAAESIRRRHRRHPFTEPAFHAMRGQPRFERLVEELHFPAELIAMERAEEGTG